MSLGSRSGPLTGQPPTFGDPDPRRPRGRLLLVVLGFVVVILIWGSTWIGIKLAIADLPPLTASGLRLLVAAPVFVVACRALRAPLRYPRERNRLCGLILVCYFAIPFFLFNYGELYVSSGLTAMCVSSVCILMIVFSIPVLRTRVTGTQVAAAVIAFLALGALIAHSQGVAVTSGWGIGAVLAAAVMHAWVYVMIKKHGTAIHTLTLNTVPMTLAGVLLTGLGLLIERPGAEAFTVRSVGATLYLGIVGSVIGFGLYFWLVQRMDTVTVSFTFVLFPIVAQFLAFAVEGTRFDGISLLLIATILAAFALAQWKQRPAGTRTADPDVAGPGTGAGRGRLRRRPAGSAEPTSCAAADP